MIAAGLSLLVGGPTTTCHAQIPDLGIDASLHGALPFPENNPWNQDISALPVDPNSAALIASIGLNAGLHPAFGGALWQGAPNGIAYIVVPGTQSLVPLSFTYADQSDPGPYPIPANAPIEGGPSSTGDRHVIVVDRDHWKLYETYNSFPNSTFTSWSADSGAVFDLTSDALRPLFWTSADAAGLPIFPGLVRADEVLDQGAILHALRFTAVHTRRAFTTPARHFASNLTAPSYPPMGLRVRLKASFNISLYPPDVQVILTALKKYGMILADNGSNWFLSGTPDPRWNDSDLHTLTNVSGSNFEVVQMGEVITDLVATPTNLHAVAGNASATLSWTAVTGATGYNIERATVSGGPYTTVAGNVASTSYTDSGLSNGTTYYYVVAAACQTGQSPDTAQVSATPSGTAATLAGLALSPPTVTAGIPSQGTVTLSSMAPAGGAMVNLSSGNASIANVPTSVTVPAGQTSATFTVTTAAVATTTSVVVSASYSGKTQTASVQVVPTALSALAVNPTTVQGGTGCIGTVTLTGPAPAGGLKVAIGSGSPTVVSMPASVTVAAGKTSASFAITTSKVASSTAVTLGAAIPGNTNYVTASLTLTP
jgi:hypothetical protein